MSSSWWMLIRSRLPDPVGGFIFIPVRKVHRKSALLRLCNVKLQISGVYKRPETLYNKGEKTMEFFNSAIEVLQTLVVALGAGLGVWGAINLLEGYGNDNPGSKSQGMKQLMAGGGVALVGITLIPLLSGLFG